ncbi:unnamed protein product [Rhizophagus irregularis]|nr:unnamed protein product [Rhizophagus irregularis]CAB5370248.1 unnamed protein product [Rhizophagus irregularis]
MQRKYSNGYLFGGYCFICRNLIPTSVYIEKIKIRIVRNYLTFWTYSTNWNLRKNINKKGFTLSPQLDNNITYDTTSNSRRYY